MTVKRFVLVFMFALMVIPFISAENIGTFGQGETINLTNYCQDGGCTAINVTSITYPNGDTEVINGEMTLNGQEGFYEFNQTHLIGTYYFRTIGSNGITDNDSFDITPNGFKDSVGFYIILLILTLGLVILGYAVEDHWIVILGGYGLMMFGLYILFFGLVGIKDTVYTWGIGIIVTMLGAYFGTRAALEKI